MILGTMPPQGAIAHLRTKNIIECSATAIESLEILSRSLGTPFLGAISSTTRSLLDFMETIKQNKQDCIELVEQTFQILNAIIVVHVESPTGGELPPTTLKQIGKFTETLYKIHTFVEAQQNKHILKNIFRHGEMGTLLKECRAGLQLTLDFFTLQVAVNLMDNTRAMEQVAQNRLQEVLDMIEALSEASISDSASSLKQGFYGSDDSINSITMLPSKPKIFNGRTSELSHIVQLFKQETPRIAILGPPGMGKTALSKVLLHHSYILARYEQRRCFVACDSVVNKVELIALLGQAYMGK
ncbi:hypothetical protein C8R43DRAFT_1114112 [Mycena crocata]|nr:hypothetical protein C8R43DRAFT_1114112 [Mycena crocata]